MFRKKYTSIKGIPEFIDINSTIIKREEYTINKYNIRGETQI